jgi:GlpG protein
MRLLGHLPDEKLARRFADYLSVQSMASQVEPEADGRWAVWIRDDDHLDAAATELASFHARPEDQKYVNAAVDAARLREQEEKEEQVRARRTFDRSRLLEKSWIERLGKCTLGLMALSILATFYTDFGKNEGAFNQFAITRVNFVTDAFEWSGAFLPEVRGGQIWRLVTPMFIHMDFIHILFNMLWLADLGSAVERRYGWRRLLVFVLVVSSFSNLLEYQFNSPVFGGMSGVVFALFGFIWTQSKYHPNSGFQIPPLVTGLMLFWFVFCIVGLGGTIANFVHWGGLASGAFIGYVTAVLSRPR